MRTYLSMETAYIRPFTRDFILGIIKKYAETAMEYIGEVEQNWRDAGIYFGLVINGSFDDYYIGLWIEMNDLKRVLDILKGISEKIGVNELLRDKHMEYLSIDSPLTTLKRKLNSKLVVLGRGLDR